MRRRTTRRGITLVETMVACFLGALLVYLVAECWIGFTRSASYMVGRIQLIREADLALLGLERRLAEHPIASIEACGDCTDCAQGQPCHSQKITLADAGVGSRTVLQPYRNWLTERHESESVLLARPIAQYVRQLEREVAAESSSDVWQLRLVLQIPGSDDLKRTVHIAVVRAQELAP